MAKVFGVHDLELQPGADAAAFERLMKDAFLPGFQQAPGLKAYFLKADRGARDGKYLWVLEFESTATRDRYYPVAGGAPSEEYQRLTAQAGAAGQKLREYLAPGTHVFTDYVELS